MTVCIIFVNLPTQNCRNWISFWRTNIRYIWNNQRNICQSYDKDYYVHHHFIKKQNANWINCYIYKHVLIFVYSIIWKNRYQNCLKNAFPKWSSPRIICSLKQLNNILRKTKSGITEIPYIRVRMWLIESFISTSVE